MFTVKSKERFPKWFLAIIIASTLLLSGSYAKAATVVPDSYTVEQGDSFWYIAQRYGLNTDDLIKLNPTVDPMNMQIGSEIRLKAIDPKVQTIIDLGHKYLGAPYAFGNTIVKNGQFIQGDCSGFTHYVFGQLGIKIPYGSYNQVNVGTPVAKSDLQPGDLIFSDPTHEGHVSHVSIYLGNDTVLHTYRKGVGVTFSKFSGSGWDRTFIAARRYF